MELEDKRVTAILDQQLEGYLKTTEKKKLNEYCKYIGNEIKENRGVSALIKAGKLKDIKDIKVDDKKKKWFILMHINNNILELE